MNDKISGEKVEFSLNLDDSKGFPKETAHLIIAAMVDGVTVVGLDGKILDCNDAVLRLHGVSRDEYVGKSVYDFIAPEDRQRAIQESSEVLQKGNLRSEVKAIRKEGGTFDAEIYVSLLRDVSRKPIAFLGVTRDITEWNKKKEELRFLKECSERIVNSIGEALLVIDPNNYTIMSANETALKQLKLRKGDLIGKTCYEATHHRSTPCKAPYDICPIQEMLKTGQSITVEHTHFDKDNNEIYVEVSAHPVRNQEGDIVQVVHLARDITERKKAEKALREQEEMYRGIVELAPDGIVTVDMKGVVTSCNTATTRISGFSKDEIVGKHISKLGFLRARDIPKYLKIFSSILRGKVPEPFEIIWQSKDRTPHVADVLVSLMKREGKIIGVQAMVRDITERKKAEETLLAERDRLETVTRNIGAGLAIISKDYRTLWANEVLKQMFGNVEGKICYSTYNQRNEICPGCGVREVFETGKNKVVHEQMGKDVDGKTVWSEITATPTKDKNGNITAVLELVVPITERKKAEEELRKFKTISDKAGYGSAMSDVEGNLVYVNESFAKMHGYTSDELIGKNLSIFHAKVQMKNVNRLKEQLKQKGSYVAEEVWHRRKDNTVFPTLMNGTLIRDEEGKPLFMAATAADITERKMAEEQLRESEERYRVLVESAADAIFTFNEAGDFLSANQEAARNMGKTPEDLIGKNMYDLFRKDIADWQMGNVKAVFQTGNPLHAYEAPTQTEFGQRWYSTTLVPVRDNHGKIIYVIGFARDVTERKEMEEKLRQYSEHLEELVQKRTEELLESEKRYSVLVEEASDGVVILQDEKIILSNKRAAEILGYPKDELIGLSIEKPVSEEYRQLVKERYQRRLLGDKVPATYEVEAMTKTGQRIPIEIGTALIIYQGRPADLVVIRDIRERKLMEEERLRLEKLATIGELATMVAHDLRNPLTSIRNAGYYIKNTCPNRANTECKAALEMLNIIEQETIFANNIINDLLDFAAKRPLQKKRKNINKLIEDSLTRSNMPENIKIETNFAKKPVAKVDEKQLERVFLNLTKNAVQAMPNGGKLTITTNETKDYIEIALADTGVGIQEENMSKIFQPLFTTKAKGIGMGLAICKRIIEEHGGTIDVKSKVDQGTSFTVKLPKKEEANNQ